MNTEIIGEIERRLKRSWRYGKSVQLYEGNRNTKSHIQLG
jgi:hypothetical protein